MAAKPLQKTLRTIFPISTLNKKTKQDRNAATAIRCPLQRDTYVLYLTPSAAHAKALPAIS